VSSSAYEAALELLLVLRFKDAAEAIETAKMRRKTEATKVHVCVCECVINYLCVCVSNMPFF
jgi:hypothetical protein